MANGINVFVWHDVFRFLIQSFLLFEQGMEVSGMAFFAEIELHNESLTSKVFQRVA